MLPIRKKENAMTFIKRYFELQEPNAPDPIDNPAIKQMTQRQLADLPLPRTPPQTLASPASGQLPLRADFH
jgi:hypothetical protein